MGDTVIDELRDTLRPCDVHCNTVELVGVYGSDETHALSAWTSTSRDLTPEKKARMSEFLRSLAQAGHHTVFEKSALHFLVTCDIATSIHVLKHRIGVSVNSESARYKELREDKYYVPGDWDDEEMSEYVAFAEDAYRRYHECIDRLVAKGYDRKRAKESARFYLPYGMQYAMDVMFNFRSFNHFVGLRYTAHAQREVRVVATKMLELVHDTHQFDLSLAAFGWLNADGVLVQPRT